MNTSLSLSFRDVRFDAVDRFGQPWLQANQVGQALGYSRSDAINTLYQSNADEFTDAMTALVKLHHGIDGAGQAREVRIGHAMKALGWHRRRECEDGKRSYVYERAKS